MSVQKPGWTNLLRLEGTDFLTYIREQGTLQEKFSVLSEALYRHLCREVRTERDAQQVWEAVPDVLERCNEQATYDKPGADWAYAWQHLLDRYVRTWVALEYLVEKSCIPMGKSGVSALDVGTGPGPSAFAIHDFYTAMVDFSDKKRNSKWRPAAFVTCVELDRKSNRLRHLLAETMSEMSQRKSEGLLGICSALPDFKWIIAKTTAKKTPADLT